MIWPYLGLKREDSKLIPVVAFFDRRPTSTLARGLYAHCPIYDSSGILTSDQCTEEVRNRQHTAEAVLALMNAGGKAPKIPSS